MAKKKDTATIRITPVDIARGECANRAKCVVAQAINRQFELGGKGRIHVDANAWSWNQNGVRHRFHPPKTGLTYLRRFDKLGETKGLEAAREGTAPAVFTLTLIETKPIAPKASETRKKQINAARNARVAKLKAQGIYRQPEKRYVGV